MSELWDDFNKPIEWIPWHLHFVDWLEDWFMFPPCGCLVFLICFVILMLILFVLK